MDIWGVPGIEAEAELLAAITTFFTRVGITSADVGLKVNSRAVLAEVLAKLGVPEDKFAATCVLVDKLEKVDFTALSESDSKYLKDATSKSPQIKGLVSEWNEFEHIIAWPANMKAGSVAFLPPAGWSTECFR